MVEKLLTASGKFNEAQLKNLRDQEKTEKRPLQDVVVNSGVISEKDLTKLVGDELDVPYVEFNARELNRGTLKLIPERIARQYHAVAFDADEDGVVSVAMEDPDDVQAISFLQKQLGKAIRVHIATTATINAALDQYGGGTTSVEGELAKVIYSEDADEPDDEAVDADDLTEDSPIAQTVNLLIDYGVKAGASDIHIEPRDNQVVVRYRIDGILREANKLPKKVHQALVSRIKILSNLKIDEHRIPQDGRFKMQVGSKVVALRVSTLPISEGEKVVMRILNESSKADTLEQLGYWGHNLEAVNHAMVQPHGMVLVTGPTGSGKSTSLFSALSILNRPSVNISTIEDPIEYKIPGANQTQVNPKAGMTFAAGLRALLRQDPNIIMVGEIRDTETADLAVQAALTGHLVFATLHTNNAATCLPRLLDMGVEPFLIASTVRVVVGQRLVRRLCLNCRETYKPTEADLKQIDHIFGTDQKSVMARVNDLEQAALAGGIGKSDDKKDEALAELSTTPSTITRLFKAHDGGCNACNQTGYKGRIGIYEVLANSGSVQDLIVKNATSDIIQDKAIEEGMVTMQMDGFIKALRGQTSLEEILRVTTTRE